MRDEQWRDVRRRHASGEAIKAIARDTGLSRNTVRRALASDVPPGSRPRPAPVPDADGVAIAELLAVEPGLGAAEIGRRIGWRRSASALRDRVRAARRVLPAPSTSGDGLPSSLTTFVGREQEVATVRRALDDRLVTLVGPGGVGKTRLALHAVRAVIGRFPDGVRVVELAALRDPGLLPRAVLDGLGVPGDARTDGEALVVRHLRGSRMLLVLDSCEHLVDAVAALVGAVLAGTRDVTVLLTSRQALGVGGEHVVGIAPLAFPAEGDPDESDVDTAVAFPSVALFAERAAAVVPGFAVEERNVADVVAICRELDGVPLALELAAVRLTVLSLRQLRDRLPDRFAVLTGGDRAGPARHRTLEATISWSFELCTAAEREVWVRSSVFTGPFDLDGFDDVCAHDGLGSGDAVDGLSGLAAKSLLVRHDDGDGVRFTLPATIRGYGHDRLDPTLARGLRRRHRDRQLRLVRTLDRQWCGPDQQVWSRRMRAERADLRAALDLGLREPDGSSSAVALAGGSFFLWVAGLSIAEHRHWLDLALATGTGRTAERARALAVCSLLASLQGDREAAASMAGDSGAISREIADPLGEATAVHMAGLAAFLSDEFARAAAQFSDAERRYRDLLPDGAGLLVALEVHDGLLAISRGALDRAAARLATTAEQCAARGDRWFRGYAVDGLGFVALLEGRTDDARRFSAEGLAPAAVFDDAIGLSLALDLAAWTAAADGDHERAAVLLGAASARWTSFGRQLYGSHDWQSRRRDFHERALSHLGRLRFDAAHRYGGTLGGADVVALAGDRSVPVGIPDEGEVLTAREREIARLVSDGLTNRQIASRLVLSPRTVEGHVSRAIAKFGFARRSQLAAWSSRRA
ncbi:ATP-binding protein [Pseudonocardia endophytica]|uniref:Putative ATPase n=1 Tax=Pseudonocardia endophytica TaxID=401976 RepID=A0A4R1I0D3_PSEEN|nr:LuxR C-terminal-related transcriptional regulator [Pseudonocardia endophytica]TCK25889.1 putative ATPase [Pseudonocardia endophytica]